MNDETMMAERLGALEEEKKQLERKVKDLRATLQWKTFNYWIASFLIALGIIAGLGWLAWKGVHSYDTNECYIARSQSSVEVFLVSRRVEWGPDRELGYSTDLDKALEIAQKQGCRAPKLPEATP